MKKILTLVLSGIGISDKNDGNAIVNANMENLEKLKSEYPCSNLYTCGETIGQEVDQNSNGALSHTLMGSGRIFKSNYEVINDYFINGENSTDDFAELLNSNQKRIHLIGMISSGNIHSNFDHFIKTYDLLCNNGFKEIYFHIITDGIDTDNKSSVQLINELNDYIRKNNIGFISTICGRFYAMDRDLNYDRTNEFYDLITLGKGLNILNYESAINAFYEKGYTDENLKPLMLEEKGIIKDGDMIIWMNYRYERSKQILQAFLDNKFNKFPIRTYNELKLYTFIQLDTSLKNSYLIEKNIIDNTMGQYLSKLNIKQSRISEIDKFEHVTSSFDGGYSGKIDGCDKFLIPSYDVLTPAMNIQGVAKKIIDCMEKDYNFILANIPNIDMLAHNGNYEAIINSCKIVDQFIKLIKEEAENNFYTLIITSDQGNAEDMLDENGNINTLHTKNPVPFIICDNKVELNNIGNLSNIAPTILDYMDISIPSQMTSDSLIKK